MKNLEFFVTLWPTFPHFAKYARDPRLSAIRLNSAMISATELDNELEIANSTVGHIPLYFDIKGRQLRVTDVDLTKDHLELELNHPIKVRTPTMVLFKAGEDYALLDRVENGNKLIFEGGPEYIVRPGESLHIRDPNLIVEGPTFLDYEIKKIEKAWNAGFRRYFLSYVQCQKDIDEFRDFVGDSEIIAKIEDKKGLSYVANEYKKQPNLSLMAARGDLYVEVDKPHHILDALRMMIKKDPEASIGSRVMLSVIHSPVPSCSDLSEVAWLYDLGYRKMMLCDELCLKDELLGRAVGVLEHFRKDYAPRYDKLTPKESYKWKPLKDRLGTSFS